MSTAHDVQLFSGKEQMHIMRTFSAAAHGSARLLASRFAACTLLAVSALIASAGVPAVAGAQWSTAYEQYYLPGKFNWTFRTQYPAADRLFNAFDYGHAILYERLYNNSRAPVSELEEDEYNFITRKLLVSPPRLPLEESAIEVNYAKLAPEAKMMFDWAHLLHRQIYDVLASENMSQADKDATIAKLVAYYKTRSDLAFSSLPKNMELMEGQPYSLAFRKEYPKFNGLIWGYHWLQVGLYEPMMIGKTQEERQAGVAAAVSRFRQMLENAPEHMPRVMPMTAAIAPTFAKRYQEAAIIFDNLHAMHDVISDILADENVPHDKKRATILEAASRYRDASSFLMPIAEWASMGEMMGIANMGGPSVAILPGWPTPTLARGASMLDAMKGMAGMQHGAPGAAAMPNMPGMKTSDSGSASAAHAAMADMPGMKKTDSAAAPAHAGMSGMAGMADTKMLARDSAMMRLHEGMMRDPVIRQRVMSDTSLRRLMDALASDASGMHAMPGMAGMAGTPSKANARRMSMPGMKHTAPGAAVKKGAAKRAASSKPAPARKAPPATKKSMPPMDMKGMKGMPEMKH